MMGERTVMQEALFYSFSPEQHVPADHLLRSIDRFVDLSDVRQHLEPFDSETGHLHADHRKRLDDRRLARSPAMPPPTPSATAQRPISGRAS